ncbi:hypothetical protein GEMRC1_003524 [Eukaryota sp. GEM-RC1]
MSNNLFEDAHKQNLSKTLDLLHKSSIKDKIDGMRRLLSMICKDKDCDDAFVEVIKNTHHEHPTLSHLINAFVIHNAHNHPTETLLAVSNHVRALSDPNPSIRSQALRVLSSLKTDVVLQDILTSAETGTTDSNPQVRASAIYALIKASFLNSNAKEVAIHLSHAALKDANVWVVAAALTAIIELELGIEDFVLIKEILHPVYRKLTHLLADFDQYLLPGILDLMSRYVRSEFNLDSVDLDQLNQSDDDADFTQEPLDALSFLDFDHRLFLESLKPLLNHQNLAVVSSACLAIYQTCPSQSVLFSDMCKTIVRCVKRKMSPEARFFLMNSLLPIVKHHPSMFERSVKVFFIVPSDSLFVRRMKLTVLTLLVNIDNCHIIIPEFDLHCQSLNHSLSLKAIDCLSSVAISCVNQGSSTVAVDALKTLIKLIGPRDSIGNSSSLMDKAVSAVSELLGVLINHSDLSFANLVDVLAAIMRRYEQVSSASCKASVVHLFRQYGYLLPNFAREMLRIAAKNFKSEGVETKLAIVSMAGVMYVKQSDDEIIKSLVAFVLKCASYDSDFNVRSRARLVDLLLVDRENLLQKVTESESDLPVEEFNSLLMSSIESWTDSSQHVVQPLSISSLLPGTLSFVLDLPLPGYNPMCNWTKEPACHDLRGVDSSSEEETEGEETEGDESGEFEYVDETDEDENVNDDDFWNFEDSKTKAADVVEEEEVVVADPVESEYEYDSGYDTEFVISEEEEEEEEN